MMDKSLLMNLNGPWSNTACMGYCLIAMRRAGVDVKTQEKVLRELELSFDGVSIEDAAEMEARYKEPYPKDCMEQDRGEQRFQTFNPD